MATAAKKSGEDWDWEAAVKELGKIFKCKEVSLETKAKFIHTVVVPITVYGCESWTVKKWQEKNGFTWNVASEESSTDTLDCQKDEQVGPGANWAWTVTGGKKDKTKAVLLRAHREIQDSLEKTIMLGKVEAAGKEEQNMRWIESIKEATGVSLQRLSRAVEDGTLWTSLIHRVTRSWSRLDARNNKESKS